MAPQRRNHVQLHYWQPSIDERYTTSSPESLSRDIEARRRELGDDLVILGHHYQTDEVIAHADFTGDSLKLSQLAAEQVTARGSKHVVFCGVHFMAESADLLTPSDVSVILPDLSAGCSMADMADYDDAIEAWELIHESLRAQGWNGRIVPVTYVNSTAAIKAFVGRNGGACCTSSNARSVFEWAMAGGTEPRRAEEDVKVLFLPDQHLGRNTGASFGLDVSTQTCVYDPKRTHGGETLGGATDEELLASSVILWAGHCSVHKLFRPEHCDQARQADPSVRVLVHPECCKEVVDKADLSGSTEFIIMTIENAPSGSSWVIGTEIHLVNRIARAARERGVRVRMLSDCQCLCTTMYRIDQAHLLWVLDGLSEGKVLNQVRVHEDARADALLALDRMLELPSNAGLKLEEID
ncbi:MAG: quinolinate synthase NadA [Phycisphaerales bacterium JB043]